MRVLSNGAARRIFLDRHRLAEAPQGEARGDALLGLIDSLGFVQLDSINTVARAQDLILFARRPRYRPAALKALYENGGALFEHWTHDAAVIPLRFYPYWELRRQRDAERLRARWRKDRRSGFEARLERVIDQIRSDGPLTSSDVGAGEARGSGGWWDWHPSKTALEYLWRSGALCVVGRDAFRKRYDLTERVLEQRLCDTAAMPDAEETVAWCCSEALARLGFASPGELAAFWAHISPREATVWAEAELAAGRLERIGVTGADGQVKQVLARPDLADVAEPSGRLRLLSPFDPALRDRKRAEHLFGFHFRVEMFVPAAQRKFGYYVFPILEGDRLVARADIKAHRDEDVMRVTALWAEPGVRWGKGRQAAFEAELERVKRLAGVSRVEFAGDWFRGPVALVDGL